MKSKQRKKPSTLQQDGMARDEQWLAKFASQLNDTLRRRALNVARGCVRLIERRGGQVASSLAEDLVADAITDTWLGRLSWDPTRRDLLAHVTSTIESRARHERKKAGRFPTASLDALDDDDDARAIALWAEAEEALAANASITNLDEMMCAIDVFERVRALAVGDLEVLTLLDAIRAGAFDRSDLMEATGMPGRRYESARRRLDTLLRKFSTSVLRHGRTSASQQSAA